MHPLQRAIESRGLTVNAVAVRAGVSPQNIYNVTTGRSKVQNMGVGMFCRIAHVLGMTADELLDECCPELSETS